MMRSSLLRVRQTAAALRAALLNPSAESLQAQMPALHLAVQTLEELSGGAPGTESKRELSGELAAMKRELCACTKLIAQGLMFTQGMVRLLSPASSGYQQDGEPVPPPAGATVVVRG
jgi:hypothetical protein